MRRFFLFGDELQGGEFFVEGGCFEELGVSALSGDFSFVEHDNAVGVFDGGEAVGDDEDGAVLLQGV